MSDKEPRLSSPVAIVDWPSTIEAEINRRTGGDATVSEIVALMIELGWKAPELEWEEIVP